MAYQAAKRMNLNGEQVSPGDRISEEQLASFPIGRLDSMRRIGYVVEVPDQVPDTKPRRKGKQRVSAPVLETEQEEEAPSIDPAEESVEVTSTPVAST